ncbi:MAG: hypothetical protein HUK15_00410 [Bacteroidales bacterium]|mgnify:CR=1 FL=1|nr:hypothetical protein [Bacteroidales bacterium]
MKRIFLLTTVILFALVSQAQTLEVPVRLTTSFDSENGKMNSEVVGFVATNVKYNDNVIIKEGTAAKVNVQVKRRKGCGKPGVIKVVPVSTTDVHGNTIMLNGGDIVVKGAPKKGLALGLGLGLGLTICCPWGLFFLCIKGEDASLPSGTILSPMFNYSE